MVALRARQLRTFLATLCVALMAMLIAQAPIATLDMAHHSLSMDHPAVALAGQVYFDHDDHLADRDHSQQAEAPTDSAGDAPTHHHHSDGPQIFPLARADTAPMIHARSLALRGASDAPPAADMIFGLERPPRTPLDVFA